MTTELTPTERAAIQRRTLIVIVASQVLGGAGLAAGITVGALLAEEMLGTSSLAGIPSGLFTLGSAGAALAIGRVSQRWGRRVGLTSGYLLGAGGAAGIVLAAVLGSVPLLLFSLFVYGAGTAANLQSRYAGADLAAPEHRGRAVSTVLVATTLGAVAGPNLVEVTGAFAQSVGIPALAGPFLLAAAAFGVAGLVLLVLLRPDPLLLARRVPAPVPTPAEPPKDGGPAPVSPRGGVALGATVMVLTQIVMVAIMTMTPVHLRDEGHGLQSVGMVIAVHVAAMFLPSPLTGYLVDRVGRVAMMIASAVTLLAAGVVAALAPHDSVVLLGLALALLGLGWNFGLISGTAVVTDAAPVQTRARTQGAVDLCVSLAGATGGVLSGVVVGAAGYSTLGIAGGVVALAIVPLVAWRSGGRGAASHPKDPLPQDQRTIVMTSSATLSPPSTAARPARLRPDIQGLRAIAVLLVVAGPSGRVAVRWVRRRRRVLRDLRLPDHRTAAARARRVTGGSTCRPSTGAGRGASCRPPRCVWRWSLPRRGCSIRPPGPVPSRSTRPARPCFAANWHVAAAGTDYLAAAGPVSPLQHFWSLAVEEQFYLLWPLAVILLLGAAVRWRRPLRPATTLTGACVVVIARLLSAGRWPRRRIRRPGRISRPCPGGGNSPPARCWPSSPPGVRLPAAARTALSAIGLALIALAAVLIDADDGRSRPVGGAARRRALLVLTAGIGEVPGHAWLLTNPASPVRRPPLLLAVPVAFPGDRAGGQCGCGRAGSRRC